MTLSLYQSKRNFRKTSEPKGRVRKSAAKLAFVVQKHDASHLHYDFRLELDGVLKSWAVPKGPSLDPAVRSLAIEVEDHPLDYGDFEGTIPRGQYGGGTVLLWEKGLWVPEGDPHEGLRSGKLGFLLEGQKLRGRWTLVRIRSNDGNRRHHWLLIKSQDKYAKPGSRYGILNDQPVSVKTGRDLPAIAKAKGAQPGRKRTKVQVSSVSRRRAVKRRSSDSIIQIAQSISKASASKQPPWIAPQLAVPAQRPPESNAWVHEIKFDGYRLICVTQGSDVRLWTRNKKDWTAKFPTIAAAIGRLAVKQAIFDGEVVILDSHGISHFQALQQVMQNGHRGNLVYVLFDLLSCEGMDLRSVPLLERKSLLSSILDRSDPDPVLQFSPHATGNGAESLVGACKLGLEGLIFKRGDSPYESKRSPNWIKVKCTQRQEFVIGGFTEPQRSRVGFGALLLGYHEKDGELVYCGRVGTGFDQKLLKTMRVRLDALEQAVPAFRNPPQGADATGVHWVKPHLVAEVGYGSITSDGLLRQPTFQGLREDKSAREIVREIPIKTTDANKQMKGNGRHKSAKGPVRKTTPARTNKAPRSPTVQIAGVEITHPTREVFAETGVTKARLAEYYASVSTLMLPHLVGRPLMLVRCPDGASGECFHQKHISASFPESIHGESVREKNRSGAYPIVNDVTGIIALVQMNTLEIHGWGSQAAHLEYPDRIIFDLDPGEGVSWKAVCDAALLIRDLLLRNKLKSFLKTSGGKGLHIVAPVQPNATWDRVKAFSQQISQQLAGAAPDQFVSKMTKSIRKGRIFVDYLRNSRGATCVLPYSTRARPGAPVSMPIAWKAIHRLSRADEFTVESVLADRKKAVDPWKDFFRTRQSLK